MTPDEPTKALIEKAQAGDQDAVAQLYEIYVDRIFRYVAYRVPQSEVEDITSDVFTRMVLGLPNYTYTGAPFEAWLYRIASARVADYHRKQAPIAEEVDEFITDDATLPEESLLRDQEFSQLRDALRRLTEDEQTLLIMRFVERKSHSDVATFLGKTEAAVRTMQHRALNRLAKILDAGKKERHYLRGTEEPEASPPISDEAT